MAVWLVRSGGTRATGSGASVIAGAEATQAEWDDLANCFNDDTNVHEPWRITRDHMADGDDLIFYDEDDGSTVITHNIETGKMLSAGTPGTMTWKSRSGDSSQCVIRCLTGNVTLLNLQPNAQVVGYVFTGLSFAEPLVGLTYTGPTYFSAVNLCSGITFNDCSIGNCNLGAVTEQLTGLIYSDANTRTITFNNTNIENITADTWLGGYLGSISASSIIAFTGTCNIRNIALTNCGNIRGGFYGDGDLTISGDVIINNIVNSVTGTSFNRAVFYIGGEINVTMEASVTADNITLTGGTSGCGVITAAGAYNINNVTASNITITPGSGQNSIGCTILATGPSAQGYIRNVNVEDMSSWTASAVDFSGGAGGTIESVIARRCAVAEGGGGVRSGGYGDVTLTGFLFEDCTSTYAGAGLGIVLHPTSSTRDKVANISNGTIINCTGNIENLTAQGDGHGVFVTNGHATWTLTVDIRNVVCRNGVGIEEMLFLENAANSTLVTVTSCDIEGGASGIDEADLNTAVTKTSITDDSTQINTNGTLVKDSAYKTAGVYVRYGSRDCNGRLISLPPSIGGFGRASCSADTRNPRL